jgi:hypothetical protein
MTAQSKEIATLIFTGYKEQTALLSVDYQDEEDLLLDRLELNERHDDSDSFNSTKKIGARDILTKQSVTKLIVNGI